VDDVGVIELPFNGDHARLLSVPRGRLDRFVGTSDSSVVLDPAAARDVAALVEAAGGPFADAETMYMLGWLHYFRFQALPFGADQFDQGAAIDFFAGSYVSGWRRLRLRRSESTSAVPWLRRSQLWATKARRSVVAAGNVPLAARRAAQRRLDEILEWAWVVLVGPVRDHLDDPGLTDTADITGSSDRTVEDRPWPRVAPSRPKCQRP
jgi:hypothetical protein